MMIEKIIVIEIIIITQRKGPQGLPGPQGPQGPQGLPGVNGTNGINGTNGVNGTNIEPCVACLLDALVKLDSGDSCKCNH